MCRYVTLGRRRFIMSQAIVAAQQRIIVVFAKARGTPTNQNGYPAISLRDVIVIGSVRRHLAICSNDLVNGWVPAGGFFVPVAIQGDRKVVALINTLCEWSDLQRIGSPLLIRFPLQAGVAICSELLLCGFVTDKRMSRALQNLRVSRTHANGIGLPLANEPSKPLASLLRFPVCL